MKFLKAVNPCICVPSRFASFLVVFADIILGAVTLYVSSFAIEEFRTVLKFLHHHKISVDVAWFGIVSIPAIAVIGIWNAFGMLRGLSCNRVGSPHIRKFVIFFIFEIGGFVAPFYILKHYQSKINILTSYSDNFVIYHLLEVNPVTMALFVYQFFSFWVVHRHKAIQEERRERKLAKAATRGANTKALLNTNVNIATNPANGKDNVQDSNSRQLQSQYYPTLDAIRIQMMSLPSYSTPKCHSVVEVDSEESEDEASPALPKKSYSKRRELTAFEQKKELYAKRKVLFEDPEFPTDKKSLGSGRTLIWKRPFEITKDARFFTDGVSRFDVKQGELGDCWFLAAVANLTLNDNLFENVVPNDNEWTSGTYCGMCHFWFYHNDQWVEVIIDDRLPTRDGKLIYLHSSDITEFWSALLEKAYAKLNGSYSNLDGNDGIGRAMINLTGGVVKRHQLITFQDDIPQLFDLLTDALDNGKMVGCCCSKASRSGIYGGHAYSVTHVANIAFGTGKVVPCIRIRNPWGNSEEWQGKFRDGHPIWELVDRKTKKDLQLKFDEDGEFWFPMQELVDYFNFIEICHVSANEDSESECEYEYDYA